MYCSTVSASFHMYWADQYNDYLLDHNICDIHINRLQMSWDWDKKDVAILMWPTDNRGNKASDEEIHHGNK